MPYNHRHYYWLFVIITLCLSPHITQCHSDNYDDDDDGAGDGSIEEDERSYWKTFASVAGQVASSAGDTVYSAASSGASTISGMFDDDNDDDNTDNENSCGEDGCVENDDRSNKMEKSGGIFSTVTNTMSSAWSNTKQATDAALDSVRSSIAGEVDAILGTIGNRIATALTPG